MNNKYFRLVLFLLLIIVTVFATLFINKNFQQYVNFFNKKKKIVLAHTSTIAQSSYATNKTLEGNDFKLELLTGVYPNITLKTAGIFMNENNTIDVYEQSDGTKILSKFNFPFEVKGAKPFRENNGGIKSMFKFKDNYFCFIVMKQDNEPTYFVSILNLTQKKEVFRTPNTPVTDEDKDFNNVGGGVTELGDDLLISMGAPTPDGDVIASLSQDNNSPYGKLLLFKSKDLINSTSVKKTYTIFTSGHRNMQGIVTIGNNIYGVEQGPKGGDEINSIVQGKNYGYPKVSFGTHYAGKPFPLSDSTNDLELPMYTFKPSVASSDITECPCNLSKKYKPFDCALISSLRGQSILVAIIDPKTHHVLSIERLDVGMRVREFLKTKNDRVFISTDGFGIFELKFSDIYPNKS
jgi:hypothetical protein